MPITGHGQADLLPGEGGAEQRGDELLRRLAGPIDVKWAKDNRGQSKGPGVKSHQQAGRGLRNPRSVVGRKGSRSRIARGYGPYFQGASDVDQTGDSAIPRRLQQVRGAHETGPQELQAFLWRVRMPASDGEMEIQRGRTFATTSRTSPASKRSPRWIET